MMQVVEFSEKIRSMHVVVYPIESSVFKNIEYNELYCESVTEGENWWKVELTD